VGEVTKQRYEIEPALRGQAVVATVLLAIALPVMLFAAVFARPHKASDRYVLDGMIVVFVLFVPVLWVSHRIHQGWLELDDAGLRQFDGWREVFVRWDEVERLEYRRFVNRLKVFARDGRVINVDKQLLGFLEAARSIAARTGRTITGLPGAVPIRSSTPVPGTLRVGPPYWVRYLLWPVTLACAWFFCIRIALHGRWIGSYVGAAVGAWMVYRAFRGLRSALVREVTVDDGGIHVVDYGTDFRIAREAIRSCRIEILGDAVWLVVRDDGGNILLLLNRQMFSLAGSMMKRFDVLADEAVRRFDRAG
jgi:hypothetical protein